MTNKELESYLNSLEKSIYQSLEEKQHIYFNAGQLVMVQLIKRKLKGEQ